MPNALPPAVSGLETRLRLEANTLTGADLAAATQCLDDATALVLAEVPNDTATAWSADAPAVVTLIIYKAARREYENPSGLSQEITGEHTITTSATSGVFLTAQEVSQVRRAAGLAKNGTVGSPRMGRSRTPFASPYWWRR